MKVFIPPEIIQISDLLEDIQDSQEPYIPRETRLKWIRYNPDTYDYEIGFSGEMLGANQFITEQIRLRKIQGACFIVPQHPETREQMNFRVFAFRPDDLGSLKEIAEKKIEADKQAALRREQAEIESFERAISVVELKKTFRIYNDVEKRSAFQTAHETNIALYLLGKEIDPNTGWTIEKSLPETPDSLKPDLAEIRLRMAKEFIKNRALEGEVVKWDVKRAFSKAASNENIMETFGLKENLDERTPRDLMKESCLAACFLGVGSGDVPADLKSEVTARIESIKKILSDPVLSKGERKKLMTDAGKKFVESRKLSGTMKELNLI